MSQTCFCTTSSPHVHVVVLFLRLFAISVYSSSSFIVFFCFFAFSPLRRLLFSSSTSIQHAFFVAWLFQSSFIPSMPVICFAALFVCCCCCGIMWLVVCFLFLLFRYPCQRLWYCGCWACCFCNDLWFFLYMNFQIVLCVFVHTICTLISAALALDFYCPIRLPPLEAPCFSVHTLCSVYIYHEYFVHCFNWWSIGVVSHCVLSACRFLPILPSETSPNFVCFEQHCLCYAILFSAVHCLLPIVQLKPFDFDLL